MSNFPERNLNQTAVYWGAPTNDGYGGFTWDDPVEINCRWDESNRLVTDDKGAEILASSAVQVDQDVESNGMMLLGTVDDLDSDAFNDPVAAGAKTIIRFDKIPTVKATGFYRLAFLGSVYRGVDL